MNRIEQPMRRTKRGRLLRSQQKWMKEMRPQIANPFRRHGDSDRFRTLGRLQKSGRTTLHIIISNEDIGFFHGML
jgi:hypothetical protein